MVYGNVYDLLKLILSFLVVSIHVNPFRGDLWYIRYPTARIAVPLFFMMSSYFFFKKIKVQETKQQLKTLLNFVKRNMILYISWFILLLPVTIKVLGLRKMNFMEIVADLTSRFFFSSTFKASWYLMGLVIGIVIVYFLSKYLNNKVSIGVGLVLYLLCAMLSNYKVLFEEISIIQTIQNIYPYAMCYSFPVGILFIAMGKVLADKDCIKVAKKDYIYLLISTVLLFYETYLVISNKWYGETPCYIMLIPFCWYFFIVISKINIKIPYGKEIRVISTIMYCFHFSFKIAIDHFAGKVGISFEMIPYSIYLYLIVVIGSIIVALIIFNLSKHKYLSFLKNLY